jgi:hypothetical protein
MDHINITLKQNKNPIKNTKKTPNITKKAPNYVSGGSLSNIRIFANIFVLLGGGGWF